MKDLDVERLSWIIRAGPKSSINMLRKEQQKIEDSNHRKEGDVKTRQRRGMRPAARDTRYLRSWGGGKDAPEPHTWTSASAAGRDTALLFRATHPVAICGGSHRAIVQRVKVQTLRTSAGRPSSSVASPHVTRSGQPAPFVQEPHLCPVQSVPLSSRCKYPQTSSIFPLRCIKDIPGMTRPEGWTHLSPHPHLKDHVFSIFPEVWARSPFFTPTSQPENNVQ